MSRTLIRGGCVLTLGAKTQNYLQADVLIEAGRVVEVGPQLRARDVDVVDATDTIVMPGFVDTHRHTWATLLRNVGDGTAGGPSSAVRLREHHRAEDIYAATLIGLLTALEAGITTVVDWADVGRDAEVIDAALQAHVDSRLRTVFVQPATREAASAGAGNLADLAGRLGAESTTVIAYGSPDPAADRIDELSGSWAAARSAGLRIHAHVGPPGVQRGAVKALAERGLLGADVTMARCADVDDADLDVIAAHGTGVSLTPATEMALGFGPPPLQRLIDRGIRPGLGVGDELLAPGDLFAQMRAVQSLQHGTSFDLKLAGKAGVPSLLTTREVIRYATLDGARAIGLGDATGSLEPGKQADLVLLRADSPNIAPINDPIGAVVWGMDPSNVDWVFVAGRPLMRSGVLEADVQRARDLAVAARERVAAAAGESWGVTAGGVT